MDAIGLKGLRRRWRSVVLLGLLAAGGCGGGDAKAPEEARTDAPAPPADAEIPVPDSESRTRGPTALEAKLLPAGALIGADPDTRSPVLVFFVPEAPEKLLDWFRGTANGADFVLESEMQEGSEYVFSGRVRETGRPFTLRIAPGVTGGTTGMIMIERR